MREFNRDEMNVVFHIVNDIMNYSWRDKTKFTKLPLTLVQEAEWYDGSDYDFLGDYEVKITEEGDHRNDGQLVDYFFTFKSPEGKETTIQTEMCLMIGWNHCESETIN